MSAVSGVLTLAATPIGDRSDASPRLIAALSSATLIAAEDTRRLRRLTDGLDVRTSGRIVSYFDGNEAARTPELVATLVAGTDVLLVTDAGMPSVSDPGYRLVVAAVEAGIRVTSIPGPSAALAALAVSGMPVDRFCFEGFLPRKAGERSKRLAALATEERTMVFFEAPHRTLAALTALAEAFGADRRGAVCRELTKTYEQVVRGGLGELVVWAQEEVRGEVTLVVAGRPAGAAASIADATAEVRNRLAAGERLKGAVADVAAATGIGRNELYAAALDASPKRTGPAAP